MKKKIICLIVLLSIGAVTAFAVPEFKMSMGFGGYFTSDFGGGVEITHRDDPYSNISATWEQKTPYWGGGIFWFFDLTYIELNLGFFATNGFVPSDYNIGSGKFFYPVLYSGFDFGLIAKYPFNVSNKFSIFPFLGTTYRLILNIYENDGLPIDNPMDFNTLWFKTGLGLDYSFTDDIYFRTGISYGIRLENDFEKKYPVSRFGTSKSLLGHGLEIKLAVGFKIGREK